MELKNINLLITGGAGFIGSHFCNYICKYVNKLVIIYKLSSVSNIKNINDIINNENVFFICDNIITHNFLETFNNYDINYIIHFAAQTHVDNSYKYFNNFIEDNIISTQLLLESIKKYQKKIILFHFSTDEIYGPSLNNEMFDENSKFNPTNPYSASKACSEMIINTYKYSYNIPIIISRCNNVYGKYQFIEKVIPCFISNALQNNDLPIHGDGNKIRDFIHIDDVVQAIIVIMERGNIGEIYNIGVDNPIKIIDLAHKIIKKIDKGNINFINDRPFNDNRYYVNVNKLELLGWKSTIDFEEGLEDVINWIKDNPTYWYTV